MIQFIFLEIINWCLLLSLFTFPCDITADPEQLYVYSGRLPLLLNVIK